MIDFYSDTSPTFYRLLSSYDSIDFNMLSRDLPPPFSYCNFYSPLVALSLPKEEEKIAENDASLS